MANAQPGDDNPAADSLGGTPTTVSVEFQTRDEHGPAGVVRQATGEAQPFNGWLDLMSRLEAITESNPPSLH